MFKKFAVAFLLFFLTITNLSGCGKYFWEYDCVWYSESPYVCVETRSHDAMIEINDSIIEVKTAWENNGTGITFSDKAIDEGRTEASIVWETKVEIKSDKLYLTITEDYVSDMEGEVIILEQQAYEE